ncbi:hypothetical protein F2Q70_00022111 [Brassica cretica]|uniref:Uncharacterized protein n=1 Tax=Brassica cretica TaxID=69181 RepID=A0A8S9GR01_BRACR|nr:hypothetical protein F2Q70_00022111 [Brassica cretica]
MFAGAVTSIVQFLKAGTMISRENSEVTLFTLLLANENMITIGESASLAWNQYHPNKLPVDQEVKWLRYSIRPYTELKLFCMRSLINN